MQEEAQDLITLIAMQAAFILHLVKVLHSLQ